MGDRLDTLWTAAPVPDQERALYPRGSEPEEWDKRRADGMPFPQEGIEGCGRVTRALGLPGRVTM
jgi:hypothetical protein